MTLKAFVMLTVKICVLLGISQSDGCRVKLTHRAWKGFVGYIAVDRKTVQEKLDYYNTHLVPSGGPLLFLPRNPVYPDILNDTQHVLYVDFGTITVFECESGDPKGCPAVSKPTSATSIPLLTDDPDGTPKYSLALNLFFQRSRVEVANINLLFPYTPVDEIIVDDDGATIRDYNEEISVSVSRDEDQCKPNPPSVRNEFEDFFNEELQFGISGPDFSYCDDYPNHQYCSIVGSIRSEVQHWGLNVCQMGWGAPVAGSCQLSLNIVNITSGFRERWLLGKDDPVIFVASESYDQKFEVDLKFPCVPDE